MRSKLFGESSIGIATAFSVVITWLAWKHTASLSMCLLFWLTVLIVVSKIKHVKMGAIFLALGAISNATVTIFNGGVMPVVGMPPTMVAASPIWRMAGAHSQLLLLADHSSLWYFSVGDFLLISGALVLVARFVKVFRNDAYARAF